MRNNDNDKEPQLDDKSIFAKKKKNDKKLKHKS